MLWRLADPSFMMRHFMISRDNLKSGQLHTLLTSAFRLQPRRAITTHWMPSTDGAVLMLIAANVAVFMLWRLADPTSMRRHFMISLDNLKTMRGAVLIDADLWMVKKSGVRFCSFRGCPRGCTCVDLNQEGLDLIMQNIHMEQNHNFHLVDGKGVFMAGHLSLFVTCVIQKCLLARKLAGQM
ncbi:hypothetical protein GUJ93_ZPchr0007g3062 [Zizania palustris]|uniref:Uncharacterized protein n=1 Tax=Zizania palustris TaxID=103762 RepID=A0A8J5SK10_ZIZPA|nr:hypothetical protein GUJ93_ZPchr0007g3062 [Zizania palustris]